MASSMEPGLIAVAICESLAKLPIIRRSVDRVFALFKEISTFLEDVIDDHERRLDAADGNLEPCDFIDAYLLEKRRRDAAGEQHFYT